MKKVFLALFSLVLILGFTACGGSTSTSGNSNDSTSNKPLTKDEFEQMYSNPDNFKGKSVDFYATIFVEPEKDDKGTYLQAWADKNHSKNTLIRINDSKLDVKENDIIHVVGVVEKKFEGENAFGAKIKAPVITASKVEKSDYATAFAPAIKKVELNKEINQNGFILKVNKVEFGKEETRVYLNINNSSKDKFHFYTFKASAVQGNKQFKTKSNYEAKYPEIKSEILPGVTEEGIMCFEPMDPNGENVKLILEGSSENYKIKNEPYNFEVPLKQCI